MKQISIEKLSGVWSASPTPFTTRMSIDTAAVKRLVEHHLRLGVKGIFLCGTCGEGPWMPERERRTLVRTAVAAARGRLVIAVQVTDNSAARILDNMRSVAEDGADLAVIAPPFFLLNATPENVTALYVEAIRGCPLPVGIYDRGLNATVPVSNESLWKIYSEPKVVLVKDSSGDLERMKLTLQIRESRPELLLLNGDEFHCVHYIKAGYDGLLLGGGIFNGHLAGRLIEAAKAGRIAEAERLQKRMNRLMWDVYGGKTIACWLAGLKHLLVKMGLFGTARHFLNYPLTPACRRAIAQALIREKESLLPGEGKRRAKRASR
ncbi:MAG: dihydrodipicolinate synthase family protein [Verrucomicrobiota bacterium]